MHLCKRFFFNFFLLLLLNLQSFVCDPKHLLFLLFSFLDLFLFLHLLGLNLLIQNQSHLLLLDFELIFFFFLDLFV